MTGQAAGVTESLRKALQPYADQIKAAFVCGSAAKGSDTAQSDIDLMVIGDELNFSDLYAVLQNAEGHLQRKVSPLFLSAKGWKRKLLRKTRSPIKSKPVRRFSFLARRRISNH